MSVPNLPLAGILHAIGSVTGSAGRAVEQTLNADFPNHVPEAGEVISLIVRGWLTPQQGAEYLKWNGVCLPFGSVTREFCTSATGGDYGALWYAAFIGSFNYGTEVESAEIFNRRLESDDAYNVWLKRYGYVDDDTRRAHVNLRYDIPGPADLVRFSVRHVWEPDLLAALGYDKEFPGAIIDYWHAAKGLDYPLFTGPFAQYIDQGAGQGGYAAALGEAYAAAGVSEPTWAKAYWWSHWVLPSPGQFFDMLIRLDPQRDRSFDPPEAEGQDFSLADYELGLRANDYPPKYRRALAAINRPIVGVRFLRGLVEENVYDYDDVIEWARRWGYSPRDRKDIADLIFTQLGAKQQKAAACKGCATCDAAFEVGVLGEQELSACYQGYGADAKEAARMASLAALKVRVRRAKEIVTNVRKRFLRGSLTEQQARGLLSQWGINGERIEEYIRDWQLEFEAGRKELSAAQAVKYACQGLIGVPDLVARLTNLGYPPDDREALVAEAAYCAANLAEQSAAKAARKDRQAKADAYTAARRVRQSLIEAQRYLASHGSPKELQKWFCAGEIGESEVFSRLNALGWPDVDIGRLLSDCKSGRKPAPRAAGSVPDVPPLVPPTPEAERIEQQP